MCRYCISYLSCLVRVCVRSDAEPVGDLPLCLLDFRLLSLCDGKLLARVRLGDQVVLAPLVLHDPREWLLVADIQLKTEVLGHQVIFPSTEANGD